MQPGDILLTEKLLFLIRTNYMLNISVLFDLSTLEYVQIYQE
jgi:hypothetical protein